MVLERRAVLRGKPAGGTVAVKVPHQSPFGIAVHPVPQDVIMHPSADIYGVDLDVAVVRKGGAYKGHTFLDQVRAPQKGAGLAGRNLAGPLHGPAEGRVGCERAGGTAGGAGEGGATAAGLSLLRRSA